ncbi:MAG: hypothetical protein QNJ38_02250 [Prochloraceae cyanobacterium]|nr:hypothetical protein [Prochloraceae cyanobacterium]
MSLFIQITPEITNYAIASNLTKMQYRLWLYLYHLDPFGDRKIAIPHPQELAEILKMSVRSIYRALRKLSQLGLFAIASSYQRVITNGVKNQPLGTKKPRKRNFSVSDKFDNVADKTGTTVTKKTKSCQKRQNQSSQPNNSNEFQMPQTNSDLKNTFSDLEQDREIEFNSQENELEIDYWFENESKKESTVNIKNNEEELLCGDVEVIDEKNRTKAEIVISKDETVITEPIIDLEEIRFAVRHQVGLNWLKKGPWNIEGKLDSNFRDWLANDWINRYGGTIYQRRADVLAHFKKDPSNLAIRWEQYQSEYLDRFGNAQMRLRSGLEIKATEQQQLVKHTGAIAKVMPPETVPVAQKKGEGTEHSLPIKKNLPSIPSRIANNPSASATSDLGGGNRNLKTEILENRQAYQIYQPQEIDNRADPNLVKELFSKLGKAFSLKPMSAKCYKDGDRLAQLNDWLKDSILYSEAVKRAKSAGYQIDFDENGVAVKISELEF